MRDLEFNWVLGWWLSNVMRYVCKEISREKSKKIILYDMLKLFKVIECGECWCIYATVPRLFGSYGEWYCKCAIKKVHKLAE